MVDPELAALVGAIAGGLVGGLGIRQREQRTLERLEQRIRELEERNAQLVELQRTDAAERPPLLAWPELERAGSSVIVV